MCIVTLDKEVFHVFMIAHLQLYSIFHTSLDLLLGCIKSFIAFRILNSLSCCIRYIIFHPIIVFSVPASSFAIQILTTDKQISS